VFYNHQTPLDTQQDRQEDVLPNPSASTLDESSEALEQIPLDDEAREPLTISPKPTRGAGGRPTTKSLGLIEEGFSRIASIIEGLSEVTGKPPSNLYRRLEKARKGPSDGQLWNIYLHYFARHEQEEAARINKPLQRTQTFRSLCYAKYKEDNLHFQELLETYRELQMEDTGVTVGQRKREIEKYEKRLHDMVSPTTAVSFETILNFVLIGQ